MAHRNGAATKAHPPPATMPVPLGNGNGQHGKITPAQLREIRDRLSAPLDPAAIKWRVTATSTVQTKRGPQKRGQLVAYADQRSYTDRLNEVFGEWGWTRTYNVQVAQNFERRTPGDKAGMAVAAKVVVVSTVTVHGLGSHTGVGEEWADDENAATRAEAQAFKRACACFGLGRYLYDLDRVWVDLDQYNRPVQTPNLPDWALPIPTPRPSERTSKRKQATGKPRTGVVQQEMLANVQTLCGKVGRGLSLHVLRKYAGVTDPAKAGYARLTTVFEKLADIGNGVNRLQRAITAVGQDRYATVCRELNVAGATIDEIPDRTTLRVLVVRLEAEAAATNGRPAEGGSVN